MSQRTKRGIKLISSSFGFAAVKRQTVKRKTYKIWVKFAVAAPCPWEKNQKINPFVALSGHTGKHR